MTRERAKTKSQTLSVGETAKRLDVSPDSVRNYCERGWLQFVRLRGSHRRVLLRSIEAFEAQRRPNKPDASRLPEPPPQKRQVDEDFEIYYLGNDLYPNELNRGYICNLSFFTRLFPGFFRVVRGKNFATRRNSASGRHNGRFLACPKSYEL